MKILAYTPPTLRWKIYFGLLTALTASGIPTMRPTLLETLSTIVELLGLVGLFGYAWSVKLPGPSVFWRSTAATSVLLMLVGIVVMLRAPAGQRLFQMPVALVLCLLLVAALSIPTIVALFRYADWIARPEAGVR